MKIIFIVLSAVAVTCAANIAFDHSVDIPANSRLGSSLLSKARRVEDGDGSGDEDYSWVAGYSLKFNSCHSINAFGDEGAGGAEEGGSPAGVQHLVNFQLCPSDTSCSACKRGGEYIVQMREFVESYVEIKQELLEAQCEAVEENCNCDYYGGDDEDACLANCYASAGLDDCGDNEDGEEEFEVERYMECEEAEFSDNAYYTSTYYIGPICARGGSAIYLDVFTDASCSISADDGVYENFNYGASLPYSQASKVSVVDSECISCEAAAEDENEDEDDDEGGNNYYNNYNQPEPIEQCTELYEQSGKCEKKMKDKSDPDVQTCAYINKVLPALEKVYKRSGGGSLTTFFMWVFVATTLGASAGAYYFYTISERSKINLSGNGQRTNGRIL